MRNNIFNLKNGNYKVVQLIVCGELHCLHWGKSDQSFEAVIKEALVACGIRSELEGQKLNIKGDNYSVAGLGFCCAGLGHSSRKQLLQLFFYGGSSFYGLTIDYDHLKRWSERLMESDERVTVDIGPSYSTGSGPSLERSIHMTAIRRNEK
ncbi:MAG: hypothetical protein WAU91_11420 [Desulfatitalea sp.]